MTDYLIITLIALLSGLTTLVGVMLAFLLGKKEKFLVIGLGFSVGLMLLISTLELAPEAISEFGLVIGLLLIILGAGVIGVLDYSIPHTHLFKKKYGTNPKEYKTAIMTALGLMLHDFPEGIALASAFLISPGLGLTLAIAIAAHNIPEGFAMGCPLSSIKKNKSVIKAGLITSLAEPAGAVTGLLLINLMPALTIIFIPLTAGAMIFISLKELLPMAVRYKKRSQFIIGAALSAIVYITLVLMIPHA